MADKHKSIPFDFSDEQRRRLLNPPPPGPVRAPTVVIFYVYEELSGRLFYTGFSLEPTYKFLEWMFKHGVRYSVRVAVRNIMTDVEELSPGQVTFTGGENVEVASSEVKLGFQWPPPEKKSL